MLKTIKRFFRTRYRVVVDTYSGYEAQFRPWWLPWYIPCYDVNTRRTLEKSKELIELHRVNLTEQGRPKFGTVVHRE